MAKLLFINGPAEGHINPTLAVVEELIRRGEEVVYFATDDFRERIERTGATVKTYGRSQFYKAYLNKSNAHPLNRITSLLRTAHIVIPSVLELDKAKLSILEPGVTCGNRNGRQFRQLVDNGVRQFSDMMPTVNYSRHLPLD